MPVGVRVRKTSHSDTMSGRSYKTRAMRIEAQYFFGKLTNVALPEVIGLTLSGSVTREFPVNFILDTAHADECSNNTSPTAGFH